VQYLERAEKLKKYLETGKNKKPVKEGASSGKYDLLQLLLWPNLNN